MSVRLLDEVFIIEAVSNHDFIKGFSTLRLVLLQLPYSLAIQKEFYGFAEALEVFH
jgi:hypothetical protein